MKAQKLRSGLLLLIISAGLAVSSCKSKTDENNNTNSANADTTMSTTPMDTSAAINSTPATAPDDSLQAQLKDATKDYPDVTATVNNGEVTLTGTISRDKLPNLMQAVQALNPKKVNNNLTIK
jgi:osmotically-inducible protein OsmY